MATIRVKYRSSKIEGGEGPIYYQVIHNRVSRQINTGYHIKTSEWNAHRGTISMTSTCERGPIIQTIKDRVHFDLELIKKIIIKHDESGASYTADDIVSSYRQYSNEYSLFTYMESVIFRKKQLGKVGTVANYRSALNSFKKFRNGEDIMLNSVSSALMEEYQAWQHDNGNCPNTISFYMRILRATYNRAIEEDIIEDRKPFRRVYTGVDKTVKRALSLKIIRKIKSADLTLYPELDLARDMFMLSFYFRGMSFVDMAYLRKIDLKDGGLTYRRRKTNQVLTIGWTKEMQQILDKYPENKSEFLLPIITKTGINVRSAYRNAGYKLNKALKRIGLIVGAEDYQSWSFYRARHSWASIAKAKGVALSIISEGMGHDNEKTTQIYLSTLETSVVDRANDYIISLI